MRKILVALILFLAGAKFSEAQGVLYQLSPPAPNAQVTVCPSPDNGYPCPVTAAIFSNVGLTQSIAQPVSLGPSGFFSFYIAAGTYVIQLSGPGYNSANRTVVTIGGGSSGGGGLDQTVNPLSSTYGAKFDVRYVYDAGYTNASPTVTFPQNDIAATTADNGKICFGANSTNIASLLGTSLVTAQNTCTFASASSFTMSANALATCTASGTVLCTFAIGTQDDATAINAAVSAAWSTSNPGKCLAVQLPSGAAFIGSGIANLSITQLSSACGGSAGNVAQSGIDTTQTGPEFYGQGPGNSTLIPLPNFNFASCTGGDGTGCNFATPNLELHDVGINGLGNAVGGSHSVRLIELLGSTGGGACTGSTGFNITVANWAETSGGTVGFSAGKSACGDPFYWNIVSEMAGSTNCEFNSAGLNSNFQAVTCFGATAQALTLVCAANGVVNSSMGQYVDMISNGPLVTQGNACIWNSQQEFFSNNVQGLNASVYFNNSASATIAYFDKAQFTSFAAGTATNMFNVTASASATIHVRNSLFYQANNNSRLLSINSFTHFIDDGGNNYSPTGNLPNFASTITGADVEFIGSLKGICTGVGTAASTLALRVTGTSTTGTGIPTTCTSTTLDAGIPSQGARTIYGLNVTATAAGTNASSGVVTVLKNGVAQAVTCTIGTGTSCNDFTHSFTTVDGDLVSIQFTTQAADTLAGVKAVVGGLS